MISSIQNLGTTPPIQQEKCTSENLPKPSKLLHKYIVQGTSTSRPQGGPIKPAEIPRTPQQYA